MRQPKPTHRFHCSNKIHPLAIIHENVDMGKNNVIGPFAVIGNIGECRGETERKGKVVIGDNNVINSAVTIDSPVRHDITKIGSNCFIMTKSHIGHDCLIEDNVTIAPGAVVGGVCVIKQYANLGINASIHQRLYVGESAMIGMGAVVTKDVDEFCVMVGSPAKFLKYNAVGAKKRGLNILEVINKKND
ncbi:MAG: hypothetical protein J5I47_13365 [Vicingus serpentipes]|nr:hypothetical protein [Vicingus serpentipes]